MYLSSFVSIIFSVPPKETIEKEDVESTDVNGDPGKENVSSDKPAKVITLEPPEPPKTPASNPAPDKPKKSYQEMFSVVRIPKFSHITRLIWDKLGDFL